MCVGEECARAREEIKKLFQGLRIDFAFLNRSIIISGSNISRYYKLKFRK